jgi:Tfp pilus assembly protein PilN
MVANVAIEVVVGSVPILGDMFDIAWRANRRNYALLVGSVDEPRKHTLQSWLFLGGVCLVLAALVLLPMLLLAWLFDGLFHSLFGSGSPGMFRAF